MTTWTEVTTAVVALYGAVLATYNLVAKWRESHTSLALSISFGVVGQGAQVSDTQVITEIANPTDKTVTINLPIIELPTKRNFVSTWPSCRVTFPYEVLPGKKCTVWIAAKELAAFLMKDGLAGKVQVRAMVRDPLERKHRSKKFGFDIDRWK